MSESVAGPALRGGTVEDRKTPISTTMAAGSTGSTIALAAYYLNECFTAHKLVAPSIEMLIVLLGAAAPLVQLVYRVGKAKTDKWAAAQGVTSLLLACLLLGACAGKGEPPLTAQQKFDLACRYADNRALDPILPLIQGLLLAKFGQTTALAFHGFIATVKTTCGTPLDLSDSAAIIQRVYDAGGNIVALVAKSQVQVAPIPASAP